MRPTTKKALLSRHAKKDKKLYTKIESAKKKLNKIEAELTNFYFPLMAPPDPARVKDLLNKLFQQEEGVSNLERVIPYIDRNVAEMVSGKRTTSKGRPYAKGSINQYRALRLRLDDQGKNPAWEDITQTFYDNFTMYLRKQGNKPNTVGKHIKVLKSVMRSAYEEGLHKNRAWESLRFVTVRKEVEAVYLTQKEIDALVNLDLSADLRNEKVRDLFLIGCHTAQRFSDYVRITPEHIQTRGGRKFLDMIQQKTKQRVVIPIRSALDDLLSKYKYTSPFEYEQKVNSRIKDIAKLADIDSSVQTTRYDNDLEVHRSIPKYKLITTHTARRTGATLMHLAGIPAVDICKVTGHTTVTALMRYLRITADEAADKLAAHSYFSPLKKVK